MTKSMRFRRMMDLADNPLMDLLLARNDLEADVPQNLPASTAVAAACASRADSRYFPVDSHLLN